ncbi:MAG: type II secretion system minor pseudopilin GspK [Candidatus Polarisedimenticolaceae bacterium]|nr:type II secretion system minor pseudopilin GspK [Candidatus Polarisedimenticolaceae bacterium]
MREQRGVALITALLIVAFAASISFALLEKQLLDIHRTENVLTAGRGELYALGGEEWARGMLLRNQEEDKKENITYDGLEEAWAQPLPPTPIETGGEITSSIEDMQSRFNLNNLHLAKDASDEDKEDVIQQLALFTRLLRVLEIDEQLAKKVADWLDRDINTRFPDGAEDQEYLAEKQPYRAANGPMGSPTELRLIKGITQQEYEKLLPHTTTLPESTLININTATIGLLEALDDNLDDISAITLADERKETPFQTKDEFLDRIDQLRSGGNQSSTAIESLISTTSSYYMARTTIKMGSFKQQKFSLINVSDDGQIRTISRSIGSY